MKYIDEMPLIMIIFACLTLGLAPFNPPHIVEKIQMLGRGELTKLVDIFDFLMHGTPWILLAVKLFRISKGT